MNKPLNIDDALFHKLVNFYTENYHLPPLAAKIYAYLIFDFDMQGFSFEELVDVLKASKSSVSCSLQLLLQNEHITVLNKIDERKRYFILNPDYVKIRFSSLIEKLYKELDILEDLKALKKNESNDEKNNIYINKLDIYIDLLNSNIDSFSETLKKLYQ